jgi:SsrA-binding protein
VDVRPNKSGFEAWLVNVHIAPYSHGNIWNHEPLRRRKLLLHRHQLEKMHGAIIQKGMSIVPLRMYFKKGRAKIELGLGKGKKKYDKREDLKKKSAEREMDQARKRELIK